MRVTPPVALASGTPRGQPRVSGWLQEGSIHMWLKTGTLAPFNMLAQVAPLAKGMPAEPAASRHAIHTVYMPIKVSGPRRLRRGTLAMVS